MQDNRPTSPRPGPLDDTPLDPDAVEAARESGDADGDDDQDDAVLAADDTGMLAGERFITQAEFVEGDSGAADDVPPSGSDRRR